MRPMQHDKNSQDTGHNYVALAVACISLAAELMLHNPFTFGIRSAGPRAFGMVLAMYVFIASYAGDNCGPLVMLTGTVAILAVVAHISAVVAEQRGTLRHTQYNGRPWLLAILPMSEERLKRCEPLLVVLCGWAIHQVNYPLGTFLIWSGAMYGFRVAADYWSNRNRRFDFNDALAEQTIAMQAMKRMRRR